MSFGFSVGDIISVTQIAWKTYTALRDASEDFQGFASEVHSLHTTLTCLLEEASSPVSILQYVAPQKKESLKAVIKNCEESLRGLQAKAKKVCLLQPKQKRQFWEEFKLAFKDKQGPRDRIAIHTACINMFLSSLTHTSLGRLELLLTTALRSASGGFSTSSDGTRDPGKDAESAWNDIGQDLLMEGISEKHVRTFADEIKAYMRYLVHGGSPLAGMNFRLDRPASYYRREYDYDHSPQLRSRIQLDAPSRFYESDVEKESNRISAKLSEEDEGVDIDDLVHSFDKLFPINEHGLAGDSIVLGPPISRLDVPRPPSTNASSGRDSHSTRNGVAAKTPIFPSPLPQSEIDKRVRAVQAEKRATAIDEARARLIKYERKKEEAERAGNKAKATDLRDNAIPDIRKRLEDLNTSSRRTSCNACLGPIVERYSHCDICQAGNYDLCKSCVESGTKCEGDHRLEIRQWTR